MNDEQPDRGRADGGSATWQASELTEAFERLKQDILWLHLKWNTFRDLYSDETRVALLNEQAPLFFGLVQHLLVNDILLSLAKLTDPASGGRPPRPNLSLERLIAVLEAADDKVLIVDLKEKLERLKEEGAAMRLHRNRRLAHRDLETSLKTRAELLPEVTIGTIDSALAQVREFMNAIATHYGDGPMLYEYAQGWGDAESVLQSLRHAQTYAKLSEALTAATAGHVDISDVETVARLVAQGRTPRG